ncbi:hypothetical protein D8B45_04390 [Candidatus Gracilibacteria bacterium]|nr:MAG: hypothetical protein D8B45_04390 [Candidatus Gracilibacteria bacterium]
MEKTFVVLFKTSFYSQLQGEFLLIASIFSFVFVSFLSVLMENCSIQLRTSQSISYFFFL